MTDLQVGDVALDMAQGRPVHVVADTGQTAREWSDANGYDLLENYGNGRLGVGPEDRVFDVVYCSDASSKPSKTYAFPESRLLRVETEAADDGRPVADRVRVDVLEALLTLAKTLDENWSVEPTSFDDAMGKLIANAEAIDDDLAGEAVELAEAARFGGGD
ncbi:MAG: hypothetical protein ACOCUA_02350 [archaeon]